MLTASLQRGSRRATLEVRGPSHREHFPLRRRHVPALDEVRRISELQDVSATGDIAQKAAPHSFGRRGDQLDEHRAALFIRPRGGTEWTAKPFDKRAIGTRGHDCSEK